MRKKTMDSKNKGVNNHPPKTKLSPPKNPKNTARSVTPNGLFRGPHRQKSPIMVIMLPIINALNPVKSLRKSMPSRKSGFLTIKASISWLTPEPIEIKP
jgi:hypothetical protein